MKKPILFLVTIAMSSVSVFAQVWGGSTAMNAFLTSTNSAFRAGKVGIGYTVNNPTVNYPLQVFDPTANTGTKALLGSTGTVIGSFNAQDAVMQIHAQGSGSNSYFGIYSGVNGSNYLGATLNANTTYGVSLAYTSAGTVAQQQFSIYGNGVERMRIFTDAGTKMLLGGAGALIGSYGTNDAILQQHASGTSILGLIANKSGTSYIGVTLYGNTTSAQLAVGAVGYSSIPFIISNSGNEAIRVWPSGQVGIGTGTTALNNCKFAVEGLIGCRELKVVALSAAWPDYVFDEKYDRLSFGELENFISSNKHLPHVASAKSVEESNGFNVGETQMNMLRSMEELYLYTIDLKKENDNLKAELQEIKTEIGKLKQQ